MTHVFIMMLALARGAGAETLTLEPRGDQLCAAETCYDRLPLGAAGLDLRRQVEFYQANFEARFSPRAGGQATAPQIANAAAGLALGARSRADFLRAFRGLVLTDLAVKLPVFSQTRPAETIPFVARLKFTDARGTVGEATVRGHLAVTKVGVIDTEKPAEELNQFLSNLIKVEEVGDGGPTPAQLTEFVGPAVIGDFIVAMLLSVDQSRGTELESIGRALQAPVKPIK